MRSLSPQRMPELRTLQGSLSFDGPSLSQLSTLTALSLSNRVLAPLALFRAILPRHLPELRSLTLDRNLAHTPLRSEQQEVRQLLCEMSQLTELSVLAGFAGADGGDEWLHSLHLLPALLSLARSR
jgi:hypothetical protein